MTLDLDDSHPELAEQVKAIAKALDVPIFVYRYDEQKLALSRIEQLGNLPHRVPAFVIMFPCGCTYKCQLLTEGYEHFTEN